MEDGSDLDVNGGYKLGLEKARQKATCRREMQIGLDGKIVEIWRCYYLRGIYR